MTELAFNLNGEPFDLPSQAAGWRVRRLKTKGAPEVVYGRDGVPLIIPIDSDIHDLREATRAEGRYRLDPVDDHSRPVPNSQASYVCVPPPEPAPEPAAPTAPPPAQADATAQLIAALLESQKQHTELARMYVSQFPVLVNALSGVIRSAGDAGLPERTPLVVPVLPEIKPAEASDSVAKREQNDEDTQEDDEEVDDDDPEELEEIEVGAESEHNWPRVVQSIVDHVMPQVTPILAALPPMAAMFATKRTKPSLSDAPGPGSQSPAPAEDASDETAIDSELLLRANAILAQLTPVEQEFARSLVQDMATTGLPSWLGQLRSMSVDEGVRFVRALFAEGRATSEANATPATRPTEPAESTRMRKTPVPHVSPIAAAQPAPVSRTADEPSAARRAGLHAAPAMPRPIAPSPGSRLLSHQAQAHLAAIQKALTTEENAIVRAWFRQLTPAKRSQWVTRELALAVPDAVAMLRAEVIGPRTSAVSSGMAPTAAAEATSKRTPTESSVTPRNLAAPTVAEPTASAPAALMLSAQDARHGVTESSAETPSAIADTGAPRIDATTPPDTAPSAGTPRLAEPPHAVAVTEPNAAGSNTEHVSRPDPVPTAAIPSAGLPAMASGTPGLDEPAVTPSVDADVPGALATNANLHIAAIEYALAPDERVLVQTMIGSLSPDARDQWLDMLLSVPPAEGAQMLREALQEVMAQDESTTPPDDIADGAVLDASSDAEDDDQEDDDGAELDDSQALADEAFHARQPDTGARAEAAPTTASASAAPGAQPVLETSPAAPTASPRSATPMPTTPTAPIAPGADLPVHDANAMALFQAVRGSLSFAEQLRAYQLAAQLPAAELRRWYAELVKLPVPEVVTRIRAALAAMDQGRNGGVL